MILFQPAVQKVGIEGQGHFIRLSTAKENAKHDIESNPDVYNHVCLHIFSEFHLGVVAWRVSI